MTKISEMDVSALVEFAARECLPANVILKDGRNWSAIHLLINELHPGKDFGLDFYVDSNCVGVDFDEIEELILLNPFTLMPFPAETEEWFDM
jgi:hypothetical protein